MLQFFTRRNCFFSRTMCARYTVTMIEICMTYMRYRMFLPFLDAKNVCHLLSSYLWRILLMKKAVLFFFCFDRRILPLNCVSSSPLTFSRYFAPFIFLRFFPLWSSFFNAALFLPSTFTFSKLILYPRCSLLPTRHSAHWLLFLPLLCIQ